MIDLTRIPFIRENNVFKSFLEMESRYIDDDFENKRMFQTMGPGMYSSSLGSAGRSSVLNPFVKNSSANNSIVMVSNPKSADGRKSVHPMMSGGK